MRPKAALAALCLCAILLGSCRDDQVREAGPPATADAPVAASQPGAAAQTPDPGIASDSPQPSAGMPAGDQASQPVATEAVQQPAAPAATPVKPRPRPVYEPKFISKSAVYDRSGPAYSLLQSPEQAMQKFPADSTGNIDWVATLERELINPRTTVSGNGQMQTRTDEILMRNTRDMPWVRFPHRQHTEWLACTNCHPRPFKEKAGANQITMDNIMRGEQCGMCHDRVAFSIFACERCHSVPHAGSPQAWW